jgi:hypothetical protein
VALGFLAGSIAISRQRIWRSVCAVAAAVSFLAIGGMGLLGGGLLGFGGMYGSGSDVLGVLAFLASVAVGIYAIFCMFWYAIRKTMSLAVGSKGGSQTPIVISGAGGGAVVYSSAARALEAEPAEDAEAVSRELGALILDIQQRGDMLMGKWQVPGAA